MAALLTAVVAGCATPEPPGPPALRPDQARALIVRLLPAQVSDRTGWATDLYAAFATLSIEPTPEHLCAAIAVAEQESSFTADPAVPNLGAIAWKAIDERAARAGVPAMLVHAALQVSSSNGTSYGERIDRARTERELSEIFEDLIGRVPMGRRLFADDNPVRTGGPMQVGVRFAERQVREKPYPYPVTVNIRHEVFTRRGGLYFGVAHLLDYPAAYDQPIYRFADFNAGRWASRNAALQNAISVASGVPLAADGDLVGPDPDAPGPTEVAARVLASRLDLRDGAIRRDLERGEGPDLESTALYGKVFALAEATGGRPLPRAALPQIELHSPKITRKLTTAWFATRVDERYRRCLARAAS